MTNAQVGNEERIRAKDRRTTFGWVGLLTGPTAWAIQLYLNWALGEVIACAPANRSSGEILGLQVNVVAAVLNAVLLCLTSLAGILAFVQLRGIRSRIDRTTGDRATWLATAGVMTSALFAVVIATSYVPISLIRGCGS
jgi:hypothetical protein